jgi:hypothetical protein
MNNLLAVVGCLLALAVTIASTVASWLAVYAVVEDPLGAFTSSYADEIALAVMATSVPTSIGLFITLPVGGVDVQRRIHGPLCAASLVCALGATVSWALLAMAG